MGGYGSSRWGWHTKKQTVEHSIKLSITQLVGKVIPSGVMQNRLDWNGHYPITRDGRLTYSIKSSIRWPDTGLPFVILDYWTHKQQRQISADLTTTDCYLGSVRYWFVCPDCEQRVGCLYLPHQGDLFACRK